METNRMKIRKATLADLDEIMRIYAYARSFMAKTGNPKQWGATGWPPRDLIEQDIKQQKCHVCVHNKEIGAVFFAMTVGLATGMGYIGFAALITIIVALLYVVLSKSNFGGNNAGCKNLKVTIPENLNYSGMFDDLFEKFLSEVSIEKVKTTNLGSMFEVSYRIRLKDERNEKELIDEIRVRNGNLPVLCARVSSSTEEL